jgi:hypothetical protein
VQFFFLLGVVEGHQGRGDCRIHLPGGLFVHFTSADRDGGTIGDATTRRLPKDKHPGKVNVISRRRICETVMTIANVTTSETPVLSRSPKLKSVTTG